MTEDYNETDTLSVFKTNIGNHRRDHINQRQIEVHTVHKFQGREKEAIFLTIANYILYHNFNVVESKVYSVFDLLYQQYTDARIAFLKKHKRVSVYDSENLMYGLIMDVLKSREQLSLNVICHQPLNMLIRDPKYLSEEECQYVMNNATHLDFLIYNI